MHVHTDDPGAALSLGAARGVLEGIEIANMHRQTEAREARLLEARARVEPLATDVVAVVAGDGNARLFAGLGAARVVEGGQSMNPSTAEILAAVEATGAPEVIVLPNNSNVLLGAEQAAAHASKPVRVVPTRSIQAGIAAMVAFDGDADAADNAAEMAEAVAAVADGGGHDRLARGRPRRCARCAKGAYLGLLEDEPVAGGDGFDEVARAVVARLLAEPRSVLTVLTGEDAPPLNGLLDGLAAEHPDVEIDVQDGGQPHYHLLLSAE